MQALDVNSTTEKAKAILRGERAVQSADNTLTKPIPHFAVDISIDEAKLNEDTTAATITPILGRIHSIQPNAKSADETINFKYVGLHQWTFCWKGKPSDIETFLEALIRELCRLSPSNENLTCRNQRCCSASLSFVIADGPMRSYLKRTKGHSGYFCCDRCIQKGEMVNRAVLLRNVNAPLRTDADFLTYHVNDYSIDEHLKDPNDLSPFLKLNFPMVSGFVIDPMHTVIEGAFGRRLEGFVSVPGEGNLVAHRFPKQINELSTFTCVAPMALIGIMISWRNAKTIRFMSSAIFFIIFCFLCLMEFWMKTN